MKKHLVAGLMSVAVMVAGCAQTQTQKDSALPADFDIDQTLSLASRLLDEQGVTAADPRENTAHRLDAGMALTAGVIQRNIDASPTRHRPRTGSIRVPEMGLWLTASLTDHDRFWSLVEAHDQAGLLEMQGRDAVVYTRGTLRIVWAVGDAYQVEMLDGPHANRVGWVNELALN